MSFTILSSMEMIYDMNMYDFLRIIVFVKVVQGYRKKMTEFSYTLPK